MHKVEPIGFFHAVENEKYAVSRQPAVLRGNEGKIVLNPGSNFEEAIKDLEGFDRIFVIYHFHRNNSWKPKVMPPRGDKKRGVFATRSPHRPNFLGLSCLELIKIEGLRLFVINHDLLDGTPIFDIKPYLVYADSFQDIRQGWVDELQETAQFNISWSDAALEKCEYLKIGHSVLIAENIHSRLTLHPYPKKQNRIRVINEELYEIAYKTWRISYRVDADRVIVEDIYTGYDSMTLAGKKMSEYNDLNIHLAYIQKFTL